MHGTIRERTKVMRGLETTKTARLMIDGYMLYYNHMRPHTALGGKTPAVAAKLPVHLRDWNDVAMLNAERVEMRKRELVDRTLIQRPSLKARPLRDRKLRVRGL